MCKTNKSKKNSRTGGNDSHLKKLNLLHFGFQSIIKSCKIHMFTSNKFRHFTSLELIYGV